MANANDMSDDDEASSVGSGLFFDPRLAAAARRDAGGARVVSEEQDDDPRFRITDADRAAAREYIAWLVEKRLGPPRSPAPAPPPPPTPRDPKKETDAAMTRRLQRRWGKYAPPPGWAVLPQPTELAWAARIGDKDWWADKRVATIWTTGWAEGTWRRKARRGDEFTYDFSYGSDGIYAHRLVVGDYGKSKTWVVIEED
mmetsp:Transcript_6217/g.18392  ORF Transcript_6217/g.18392 Transcript_6217/m.18392 type:complete len:199 (+) Transcript_6217:168-764(+)